MSPHDSLQPDGQLPSRQWSVARHLDRWCDAFESELLTGSRPRIEDYLKEASPSERAELLAELLGLECAYRKQRGETLTSEEYEQRFGPYRDLVRRTLAEFDSSRQSTIAAGASSSIGPHDTNTGMAEDTKPYPSDSSTEAGDEDDAELRTLGSRIVGNYEMVAVLGRGGMGVVLKARDRLLGRFVAIKVPLIHLAGGEGRKRFLREARSSAGLRHPNICPIYEVNDVGDRPYLVMQFVEGDTLRQWARTGRPNGRQVADVVAPLARAISYAHENGVIHRDIKPANVMIEDSSHKPVLMDFGLAKELAEADGELTYSGQVMGTPAYMAPEQAAGETDRVGPLSDVYSLGAVLFELICDRPPFTGGGRDVLSQVLSQEPPRPRLLAPKVHRDLETICMKAMAKSPADRYPSASAMADDLERFVAGEPITARRPRIARRVWVAVRRRPARFAFVVVLLALAAASYSFFWALQSRQVMQLTRQFNEGLKAPDWNDDMLASQREILDRQAAIDSVEAKANRLRLREQLVSVVEAMLETPRLQTGDLDRIESHLGLVARLDAAEEQRLRAQYENRLADWHEVFSVKAPYDALDAVFATETISSVDRSAKSSLPQLRGAGGKTSRWLTKIDGAGDGRIEVEFGPNWQSAASVGAILNGDADQGYAFVVIPPSAKEQEAAQSGEPALNECRIEIRRGEILLREHFVSLDQLVSADQPTLRLIALREGNRLQLQVNSRTPLVFDDIFPLIRGGTGRYGVIGDDGVELIRLSGFRKFISKAPSPLEQGDEHFALGECESALAQYDQQRVSASDSAFKEESQYKAALCLKQLNRQAEAVKRLESLTAGGESKWRLRAAIQLWLIHLESGDFDESEEIFDSLSLEYEFDELATLIPRDLRESILSYYLGQSGGIELLIANRDRVKQLERLTSVRSLLGQRYVRGGVDQYWFLLRAYHAAGRLDESLHLAQQMLAEPLPRYGGMTLNYSDEYGWLLRETGNPTRALAEIDRLLYESPDVMRDSMAELLVERARILAALKKWKEAEADVDKLLASRPPGTIKYHYFSAACLVKGFLRQREGDHAGAQTAWRQGLHKRWLPFRLEHSAGTSMTGMEIVNALLLASLADELSEADFDQILALSPTLRSASVASAVPTLKRSLSDVVPALRKMWRTERGSQWARRMAFQDMSFPEYLRTPPSLLFLEVVRHGAIPDMAAEVEELVWRLAQRGTSAFMIEKRIDLTQLAQLMLTWKGTTNLFGWRGVARSLDPDLRGTIAFVFGHRFLRLNKPIQAVDFFRTAQRDAAPDSPLYNLSSEQIRRLEIPEPDTSEPTLDSP